MAQPVKNLPAVRETWVWSLGWEDPLEKGKASHSSILAWRFPWAVFPWGHRESDTTEPLALHSDRSVVPSSFLGMDLGRAQSYHVHAEVLDMSFWTWVSLSSEKIQITDWRWQSLSFQCSCYQWRGKIAPSTLNNMYILSTIYFYNVYLYIIYNVCWVYVVTIYSIYIYRHTYTVHFYMCICMCVYIHFLKLWEVRNVQDFQNISHSFQGLEIKAA